MARYATNCMRYLDMREIRYSIIDDYTLRVSYSCENIDDVSVYVRFDKDGGNAVTFHAFLMISAGGSVHMDAPTLLYRENHSLGEWFKRAYGDEQKTCFDKRAVG